MTNLDIGIIIGYFAITIIIGYFFGRNVKTMRDYAIGSRNFTTTILVGTIFATWIDSESTFNATTLGFKMGFVAAAIGTGSALNMMILRYAIPNIHKNFKNTISAGEMMEQLYGPTSRIFTGIASTLISMVFIATQYKATSYVANYFLGMPPEIAAYVSAAITITYACFGGIRAVTFTDMFQFYIVISFIPIMCGHALQYFGALPGFIPLVPAEKLSIHMDTKSAISNIFLFLSYSIPLLSPPIIQRVLMASSVDQAKKAFGIAALLYMLFMITTSLIGLIALVSNPDIDPNNAFVYVADKYMPIGLKGFAVAGMLAVIMSSADSFMNTGAVALAHDVIHPLSGHSLSDRAQLIITRAVTFIIGILATIIASRFNTILELMLYAYTLWGPVITIPLVAGIMGYKAPKESFYSAMVAGISVSVLWEVYHLEPIVYFGSLIPALLANLIAFITTNLIINRKKIA